MLRYVIVAALFLLATPASAQFSGGFTGNGGSPAPSGAAGGGLTGTYPNPTVATVPASALPLPTASTLGGVMSLTATASQWLRSIGTDGIPTKSQPAFTDISGSVAAAQMPALTGDCTTSAGAVATSCIANSKVVNSTYNLTTASGTQVVSGFGFTPSACNGFGTVAGSVLGIYTTYNSHSDSALNQVALYATSSTTAFSSGFMFVAGDATGTNFQAGAITAYASNQLTITWTKTGSPTGTFSFTIRCLK